MCCKVKINYSFDPFSGDPGSQSVNDILLPINDTELDIVARERCEVPCPGDCQVRARIYTNFNWWAWIAHVAALIQYSRMFIFVILQKSINARKSYVVYTRICTYNPLCSLIW